MIDTLLNVIMGIKDIMPWVAIIYAIRKAYSNKPKRISIAIKDSIKIESKR